MIKLLDRLIDQIDKNADKHMQKHFKDKLELLKGLKGVGLVRRPC